MQQANFLQMPGNLKNLEVLLETESYGGGGVGEQGGVSSKTTQKQGFVT